MARVATLRGLRCRVFLSARAAEPRRAAIAAEGAEVVVVDGTYEDAVAAAAAAGAAAGAAEIADVGTSDTARFVIDGYATLFSEVAGQGTYDLLIVPIGVGSLGAAAAGFAAHVGTKVIGVEPVTAACLAASLAAGTPARRRFRLPRGRDRPRRGRARRPAHAPVGRAVPSGAQAQLLCDFT